MKHLQSKTVAGLTVLLVVACTMALFDKLTPELADVLKWIGGTYFGVRTAANIFENRGKDV